MENNSKQIGKTTNDNAIANPEELSDRNTGLGQVIETEEKNATIGSKSVTGGDMDANTYQAEVVGEEAVGGETPTPGQNNVDELGKAVGMSLDDGEELAVIDKLEARDEQRLELDVDANR